MLPHKYYLNTVTRAVSKHTATILSYYHINITITQSHIQSVNTQLPHFFPILRMTSAPKNLIDKQAHFSPLDGVQPQNNTTDGLTLHSIMSVAAGQQEVSLLLEQPEHLEQGPLKNESASEFNTHQEVDSRYVKVCS